MALLSLTRPAQIGRIAPRAAADSSWKTRAALLAVACAGIATYVVLGSQPAPPRAADRWTATSTAEVSTAPHHTAHE